jgi:hypothetical protein
LVYEHTRERGARAAERLPRIKICKYVLFDRRAIDALLERRRRTIDGCPGALVFGDDRGEAVANLQALALRVLAELLAHREAPAELLNVAFKAM